jgi:ketosteroid isomerase-like protein
VVAGFSNQWNAGDADKSASANRKGVPMPTSSAQACTADFTAALIARDMETALSLLTDDVIFFYSDGSTIVGKDSFSVLMTANWKMVIDYVYSTANPVWVAQTESAATVVYSFTWTGKVGDQAVGGAGRATRVLKNDGSGWCIAHEHLSAGDWKP